VFLAGLNCCANVSANGISSSTCFANYCDWRIPTLGELKSIVTPPFPNCNLPPCIDPVFGETSFSFYWSSTTFAGSQGSAWAVIFVNGLEIVPDKSLLG
jgi:hypothetical protein